MPKSAERVRCTKSSNNQSVPQQERPSLVKTFEVSFFSAAANLLKHLGLAEAMKAVDRGLFCQEKEVTSSLFKCRDLTQVLHFTRCKKVLQGANSLDISKYVQSAYMDSPQVLGYGATISAPHMHATCLELLKDHLQTGNKVSHKSGSSLPPQQSIDHIWLAPNLRLVNHSASSNFCHSEALCA